MEIYNVGTGKGTSVLEVIRTFEKVSLALVLESSRGLTTGDKITKVNGEDLYGRGHFMELVRAHKASEMQLTVERYTLTGELKETAEMTLVPKFDKESDRFLVGIQFLMEKEYPTPAEQLSYYASSVFRILRAFVTPIIISQHAFSIGLPREYVDWAVF